MITVTVNGQAVNIEGPLSVQAFLEVRGINARAIALAVNGEVLPRSEYAVRLLQEGDSLEVVRAVGGG